LNRHPSFLILILEGWNEERLLGLAVCQRGILNFYKQTNKQTNKQKTHAKTTKQKETFPLAQL
jgi:hypothetical protein